MTDFDFAEVNETIAAAIPEREALVWRDRRLTHRAARRAQPPLREPPARRAGSRVTRERAALAGHESGQDHLAHLPLQRQRVPRGDARRLQGARRAAQRQLPLRRGGARSTCSTNARARAVIYHAEFAPRVAAIRDRAARARGAAPGGATTPATRCCPARWTTRRRSPRASPAQPRRHALARRPLHPLHRRHDRHAEGRAVALGRHLRVGDGRPARRRHASSASLEEIAEYAADGGRSCAR